MEHRLDLSLEPRRSAFLGSVTEFGGNDDAGADLGFADFANPLQHQSRRVANEVRDYIGIKQVARQISTCLGGGSGIGGNSSSIGWSVASNSSSDPSATGSIISREPSFRIITSSPGSSNSRGIRTAWFRPFLKSLARRLRPLSVLDAISRSICQVGPSVQPLAWALLGGSALHGRNQPVSRAGSGTGPRNSRPGICRRPPNSSEQTLPDRPVPAMRPARLRTSQGCRSLIPALVGRLLSVPVAPIRDRFPLESLHCRNRAARSQAAAKQTGPARVTLTA